MTTSVADERARLRERLAHLDQERGQIDFALRVLDRLDPDGSSTSDPPSQRGDGGSRRKSPTGRSGGTLDRAVYVINGSDHAWRIDELINAMRQNGWTTQVANEVETVRSALSRAVRDGLVERLEQGVFAPKRSSGAITDAAGETKPVSAAETDDSAGATAPDIENQ